MKNTKKVFLFILIPLLCSGCYFAKTIGSSMFPSIQNGDFVVEIINKNPNRGDIVCFDYDNKILMKRVIGVPYDFVRLNGLFIYVNGKQTYEPYVVLRDTGCYEQINLNRDEFYVLGDNRPDSTDSRYFGPVKRSQIRSKFLFRIWRR